MLPHQHFGIAGVFILLISLIFFPENTILTIIKWILVGGIVSALLDLDMMILVSIKSKKHKELQKFKNPKNVMKDFKGFMDALVKTGVLKTGLATHIIIHTLVVLLFYFFINSYFIPVLIGAVTHIASDLPHLRRLF